jgi:hypothetical protein
MTQLRLASQPSFLHRGGLRAGGKDGSSQGRALWTGDSLQGCFAFFCSEQLERPGRHLGTGDDDRSSSTVGEGGADEQTRILRLQETNGGV